MPRPTRSSRVANRDYGGKKRSDRRRRRRTPFKGMKR